MNRFESPEAIGNKGGVDLQLAYQGQNEVQFTNDFFYTPPSISNPSVEQATHRIMTNGALGLAERFDISLSLFRTRIGVKYQILGEPSVSAEKGNISLAVSGAISGSNDKQTAFFGTVEKSSELSETQYDFALIAGWRPTSSLLVYGGPFVLFDLVNLSYTPALGAATQDSSGTIRSYGANLGLQVPVGKIFIRAEGAGTRTKIGNANVARGTYGLSIGASL